MKQFVILLIFISSAFAQLSDGVWKKPELREFSSLLYIPDFAKVQYGGYLGFTSVAFGYQGFYQLAQYSVHYGYTPPSITGTDDPLHTVSLKTALNFKTFMISENIAWGINAGFALSLTYGNTIYGLILPDYFPRDYYLAINFQVLPFVGPRVIFLRDNPVLSAFEIYGEVTVVGDYLWYGISEDQFKISDGLGGSIGVSFYFRKPARSK